MTGDVAQYVSAQTAYQQAIQVAPNSGDAHSGNARVMSTLHDFTGALDEATRTLVLDPSATAALGVVFDASLELGHLDQAQQALDVLSQRSESPSIATRQARLDFLRGDTASAVALAETAASDAADRADLPSSVAFYNYAAAEYELLAGNLDAADAHYATALTLLPGYPLAVYGQARLAYARGDVATATALATTATAALPRPDMLAFLGDLYALAGDSAKATDQYATVDFIASMTSSAGGRVYDREYGLYLSDHGTNVAHALELAQAEFAERKDVYGYDALAWALHANGRDVDALTQINQALALGTVDAKLLLHAGLIELANGQNEAGRAHLSQALALHPALSPLVVDAARKALGQ
jgi:tetratricopeptide (TPR) repeat protein